MRSGWVIGVSRIIVAVRIAVLLVILVIPTIAGPSWLFFSFQMIVAAYLAISFDLSYSYGRVLSFMQGTFFGVGAYVTVYLASEAPWGFPLVLCGALVCGLGAGAIVGVVLMRLKGHNGTIATVVLAAMGLLAGNALGKYTGGEDGLQLAVQSLGFGGFDISTGSSVSTYYIAAVPLAAICLLSCLLQKRRVWKVLEAVAQNESRAQQLGFNVHLRRLVVFSIAAGIAAVGGAFYAILMQHVTTHVLDIGESVNAILWAVVGGLGTAFGALVGVLVIFPITEVVAGVFVYVQILVGALLVVAAVFFPEGIMGFLKKASYMQASPRQSVRDGDSEVESPLDLG